MRLTPRMLNAIHAVTLAGCVLILGMTLYTWNRSGELDLGSIAVVVLIITLVALQRVTRKDAADRSR